MLRNFLERVFHSQELKRLRAQRKSLLNGNPVYLTVFEKKMIFDALCAPGYRDKVEMPATKHFIREIYRILKAKIAASIKEMG